MSHDNGTAKHSASPPNPPSIEEMRTQTKYLRVANRLKREMVEANVLESFDVFGWANFSGGTDLWQGLFPKSQAGGFVPPTQPMDRRGGRKYPIIINDTQLNSYRQASRVLVDTNAYAAGTLRNWVNYVIAKGMTYKAGGRDTDAAKRYAESGGQRDAMESKDASGHEHAADSGQFTSGSGGTKKVEEPKTAEQFAKDHPPDDEHEYVYRVQPKGKGIAGHKSMTSEDEPDERGVHVFGSLEEAKYASVAWGGGDKWKPEIITVKIRKGHLQDTGDYEGYVINPNKAEIVHRQPFKSWKHLKEYVREDKNKHDVRESREVMESLDDGTEDEMAQTPLDRLAQATQHVIDRFCERNAWNAAAAFEEEQEDGSVLAAGSTGEREACWRTARDGGSFIEIFRLEGGDVDIRFVDPELIWGYPPGKTAEDGWSFGIQHKVIERITEDEWGNQRIERHHDRERIVAYYIRNSSPDERGSANDVAGRIVPARDIIQIKKPGEDREVKQSAPWFSFDTLDAFVRASNGQRAVSKTAAFQGSIAQTWKHLIGTKEQIQSLQNGPTAGLGVGNTAPTIGTNRMPDGAGILRVPNSSEPVDLPTSNIQAYQMAFQGDLRQAGQAFCAPEYLVSGDASNGNFASSQEAGVPWVRGVEADQEHFKTPFLRLMWRVVQWAVKCESLPREALELITIECEPTQVHKNNEGEMAGVMTQRLAAKVTSPQIEAAKIGNDWRKVITDNKEFAKISQPEQQPSGMPQPGQEQAGGEQETPVDPQRSMAAQQAAQARGLQIAESAEEWITIPDSILPMEVVRDLMEGDDFANEKQIRIAKMREILRAKIGAA